MFANAVSHMITSSAHNIEAFTRAGWWGQDTLFDLLERRAAQLPHAEALVDPSDRPALLGDAPQRLRYHELLDRVLRMAAQLEAIGIGPDQVVMAQLPNVHELVVLLLAASRIGAIVSPLALQYRSSEITWVAQSTGASAFITVTRCRSFEHAAYARAHLPDTVAVFTITADPPPGVASLDAERRLRPEGSACEPPQERAAAGAGSGASRAHPIAAPRPDANDLVTICWTSGTEGRPKGVPRSSNHWIAVAQSKARLDPDEVYLCAFPLVAMASIGGQLIPWLCFGGKFVLHHPFDLDRLLEQIRHERVTYTSAPPAILMRLLGANDLLQPKDLASLRTIGSGSAPLAPAMLMAFHDRFGIEIINNFGSNEGCALFATQDEIGDPHLRATHFPAASHRASGAPYSGAVLETRLIDPATQADISATGVAGELCIRGPTVIDGYWGHDGLDRRAFDAQGYFHTGDLLELVGAEAGSGAGTNADSGAMLYRFVGRSKEIIVRGGMKISPAEIEEHLAAQPQIQEAACVSYADPVLGERVAVAVVPRPGEALTLEQVVAFLRQRGLATYKLPERIYAVEGLPRNPNNKVIRSELKQQLGIG